MSQCNGSRYSIGPILPGLEEHTVRYINSVKRIKTIFFFASSRMETSREGNWKISNSIKKRSLFDTSKNDDDDTTSAVLIFLLVANKRTLPLQSPPNLLDTFSLPHPAPLSTIYTLLLRNSTRPQNFVQEGGGMSPKADRSRVRRRETQGKKYGENQTDFHFLLWQWPGKCSGKNSPADVRNENRNIQVTCFDAWIALWFVLCRSRNKWAERDLHSKLHANAAQ